MKTPIASRLPFVVLLMVVMGACTPTSQLYRGQAVHEELTVPLAGSGSQEGTWSTFDMTIDYEFRIVDDRLQISGDGRLSQHYQLLYTSVRQIRVYLFLLDASRQVLHTALLPAFLIDTEDTFHFTTESPLSPEVKAFAFGYSGRAYEDVDQVYFDKLP